METLTDTSLCALLTAMAQGLEPPRNLGPEGLEKPGRGTALSQEPQQKNPFLPWFPNQKCDQWRAAGISRPEFWQITFYLSPRSVSLMKTVTQGNIASSPPWNTSVSSASPSTQWVLAGMGFPGICRNSIHYCCQCQRVRIDGKEAAKLSVWG